MSITGTLTASHVAAAAMVVKNQPLTRPARTASTRSGPSSNNGYSLAAVPSPRRTPQITGQPSMAIEEGRSGRQRDFDHAHMAAAVRARANRSQLVNAWTTSSGDTHMMAVSQIRRRAIRAVNATAAR